MDYELMVNIYEELGNICDEIPLSSVMMPYKLQVYDQMMIDIFLRPLFSLLLCYDAIDALSL
jgi:hypothetical protein